MNGLLRIELKFMITIIVILKHDIIFIPPLNNYIQIIDIYSRMEFYHIITHFVTF